MMYLENLLYMIVYSIPNEGDVFWLNYNEDSFRTISTYDTYLTQTSEKLDSMGITMPNLDKLLSLASVQPVDLNTSSTVYHLATKFEGVKSEPDMKTISIGVDEINLSSEQPIFSFSVYHDIVANIINNSEVEKTVESIADCDFADRKIRLSCLINREASLIAAITRRGAGNTIVIGEKSIFDEILFDYSSMYSRFYINRSPALKANQLIVGYRGDSGGMGVDAGCIVAPKQLGEPEEQPEEVYYNSIIYPTYYRILEIEDV